MRLSHRIISLVLVGGLLGCATIMNRGGKQWVTVTSTPIGATATIDGMNTLQTPGQIKLKKNRDHTVVFELAGHEKAQVLIEHDMSNWVWGNLLIGGLIGLAIDFGSGGAYKLEPEVINVTLKPLPQPTAAQPQ